LRVFKTEPASTRVVCRALIRVAAAVGLASCSALSSGGSGGGDSSYGAGDPALAAPNLAGGPIDPFLADGRAVLHALDVIAEHSGSPLRVTSMDADATNGLTVEVQEPKQHVNVDQYIVAPDGKLTGPVPVKLASLDSGPVTAAEVDQEAFDPKSIGFARLARTAREAIAKSKFSDARVKEWELKKAGPGDYRWYLYLDAARGRPVAVLKPDGSLLHLQF
jgi:hypothetical protein